MQERNRSRAGRTVAVVVAAFAVTFSGLSVASAQGTAKAQGTGPQPAGLGLGSKAALSQDNCAPNGHTNFSFVGGGRSV